MTDEEYELAVRIQAEGGGGGPQGRGGLRDVAARISELRGAHLTGDGWLRRQRAVTKDWVQAQLLARRKTTSFGKVEGAQGSRSASEKSPVREVRDPEGHQ